MNLIKRYIALTCLIFITAIGISGKADDSHIKWDSKRPLTLDDFTGPVDYSSQFAAYTNCRMTYKYNYKIVNGKYMADFVVDSYFDKNTSWLKPGKGTPDLLAHEQIHFDIHELFARQLLQLLKSQNYSSNIQEEVSTLFKKNLKETQDMQDLYDKQTGHGRDLKNQQVWDKAVHGEIEKLPSYSQESNN